MFFPVFLCLLRSSSIKYPVSYFLVSSFLDPRVQYRDIMIINIVNANNWNLIESIMLKAKTLLKSLIYCYLCVCVCVCVCACVCVCVCEREREDS